MPWRLAIALIVLALALAACDGDSDADPTATAPAIDTPAATTTAAEVDARRTGIPELDAVLDTLFSGDREAVAALIQYTPTECAAEPVGIGAPPQCPEGVADGTPVDAFLQAACHGFYTFPDAIGGTVDTLTTPGGELYGVYEIGESWPPADHAAVYTGVFENARPDDGYVVFISNSRVTGTQFSCAQVEEFVSREYVGQQLVGPPEPASGRTGVLVVDGILDYIERGDAESLDRLVEFRAIPCITTPEGIGAPPLCREGEPEGERIAVFSVQTCEFEYRREDELGSLLDYVEGGRLHGAYESGAGNYWIVYETDGSDGPAGAGLLVEGRTITSVDLTCGDGPEGIVARAALSESLVQP